MSNSDATTVTLRVYTITCGSCVKGITESIKKLGSGITVKANLETKEFIVKGPSSIVSFETISAAIKEAGHEPSACSSNSSKGKCSAGTGCTCGPSCACGDNCTCSDCPGTCGESDKGPCKARALGTCTCGPVCNCGDNCQCASCPSGKQSSCCSSKALGKCSAGDSCTCGDDCQCGDSCQCSSCPGEQKTKLEPCKAKRLGTCTCGSDCNCGENCNCSDCPGSEALLSATLTSTLDMKVVLLAGLAFTLGYILGQQRS
mmetsp:Transcript_12793/g.14682  ORF Transcript_12793/g.14682 Transcript_12793/m.14682 type:complete len:259 (-) Transcript_12793:87-863(-)